MSGSNLRTGCASRLQEQKRVSCLQNNAGPVTAQQLLENARLKKSTLSVQYAQILQDTNIISGAGACHLVGDHKMMLATITKHDVPTHNIAGLVNHGRVYLHSAFGDVDGQDGAPHSLHITRRDANTSFRMA